MRAQSNNRRHITVLYFFCLFYFGISTTAFSQDVVKDSSFEAGHPNVYWAEQSTNFSGVICNYLCGNCSGKCIPRSGAYFVWLGGSTTLAENSEISQNILLSNENIILLRFYLKIPYFANNQVDNMTVWMDTVLLYTIGFDSAIRFQNEYLPVEINIRQFVDEQFHELKFQCYQSANPSSSSFLIDDVSVGLLNGCQIVYSPISDVEIIPNPVMETLCISTRSDYKDFSEYKIYNTYGKLVLTGDLGNYFPSEIDVTGLEKGEYFLVIYDRKSKSQQTEKFIKQ